MIIIDRVYIEKYPEQSRLCADIFDNGRRMTLWYGVSPEYEKYLVTERCDAFVVVLIRKAVTGEQDITGRIPISPRLKYQLNTYLLPALSGKAGKKTVLVHAPEAEEILECENRKADDSTMEIAVSDNISECLPEEERAVYRLRKIARAMVLQKRFGSFVLRNRSAYRAVSIDFSDTACMDLLTAQMLSTENLKVLIDDRA